MQCIKYKPLSPLPLVNHLNLIKLPFLSTVTHEDNKHTYPPINSSTQELSFNCSRPSDNQSISVPPRRFALIAKFM